MRRTLVIETARGSQRLPLGTVGPHVAKVIATCEMRLRYPADIIVATSGPERLIMRGDNEIARFWVEEEHDEVRLDG